MKLACFIVIAFLAATTFATTAHGQSAGYPTKPVRIVVPFAPGGATDIIARVIADRLTRSLGQPFVVENKAGASGMIGEDYVAKAAPDGYTLLMTGNGPHAINVSLFSKVPYDPVRDFAPISLTAMLPLVLNVHPSVPVTNVKEFVAWAKANPGKLNYASPGQGSPPHLTMELFRSLEGIDVEHVPYKGSAPALNDLLGGQVGIMFDNVLASYQHIKSGKIRSLAIGSKNRLSQLPDVPTFAESGLPNFEAYTWTALVAPAATPRAIVDRLAAEVAKILDADEVRVALAAQGAIPQASTPAELKRFTDVEITKWAAIIKRTGVKDPAN
jgi:tripartite-type tricarboxylate transporter receptor subunit TctC